MNTEGVRGKEADRVIHGDLEMGFPPDLQLRQGPFSDAMGVT